MKPIIRVQQLGKQFTLGYRDVSYKTLRETLTTAAQSPWRRVQAGWRRLRGAAPAAAAENSARRFWALQDVNFEIRPGEIVGVIGRNGAGKSTLLKVLSRVTEPTCGRVELYGRVGSLLEVGTGFHPELTGRENIFLNGAILGMRRTEIRRRFDEIVAFAGVEEFLDTPVKRYSSGMFMRLAFAVAAHLEPEILVIDEVLAVGDAEFQKKCLRKMQEVGRGGRTILFVSHNMAAVRNICHRGLILERGRIVDQGDVNQVVDDYLVRLARQSTDDIQAETATFVVHDVRVTSGGSPAIKTFDPVEIRVSATAKTEIRDPGLYIGILTLDNQRLSGLDFKDFVTIEPFAAGQRFEIGFTLEMLPLLPGTYQIEVHLKDMAAHKIEFVPQTYPLEVMESPVYGGRKMDSWYGHFGLKARCFADVPPGNGGPPDSRTGNAQQR